MPQLMTQAEFARHRGVSKPAVSNWKKAGLLVFSEDPATGKPMVDVARSEARVNARVDPGRGRPPSGGGAVEQPKLELAPESVQAAAARTSTSVRSELLQEQLHGHRLKNAEKAGELAPVIELQRRAAELGRSARERVHSWFRGIAERLAAERDPRAIMAIGEEGIDQVFADLAEAARNGAFALAEDEPPADEDLPEPEGEDDGEAAAGAAFPPAQVVA